MLKNRRKIIIIVVVAILIIVVAAIVAYASQKPRISGTTPHPSPSGTTSQSPSAKPVPTKQPPSSAPSTQPTPTPTPPPGTKITVKPIISTLPFVSSGQLHLRAYADNAPAATCTVTFMHAGSPNITATAATNSQGICQGFDLDAAQFAKGSWQTQVSVSSSTLEGTSDVAAFTVN